MLDPILSLTNEIRTRYRVPQAFRAYVDVDRVLGGTNTSWIPPHWGWQTLLSSEKARIHFVIHTRGFPDGINIFDPAALKTWSNDLPEYELLDGSARFLPELIPHYQTSLVWHHPGFFGFDNALGFGGKFVYLMGRPRHERDPHSEIVHGRKLFKNLDIYLSNSFTRALKGFRKLTPKLLEKQIDWLPQVKEAAGELLTQRGHYRNSLAAMRSGHRLMYRRIKGLHPLDAIDQLNATTDKQPIYYSRVSAESPSGFSFNWNFDQKGNLVSHSYEQQLGRALASISHVPTTRWGDKPTHMGTIAGYLPTNQTGASPFVTVTVQAVNDQLFRIDQVAIKLNGDGDFLLFEPNADHLTDCNLTVNNFSAYYDLGFFRDHRSYHSPKLTDGLFNREDLMKLGGMVYYEAIPSVGHWSDKPTAQEQLLLGSLQHVLESFVRRKKNFIVPRKY